MSGLGNLQNASEGQRTVHGTISGQFDCTASGQLELETHVNSAELNPQRTLAGAKLSLRPLIGASTDENEEARHKRVNDIDDLYVVQGFCSI